MPDPTSAPGHSGRDEVCVDIGQNYPTASQAAERADKISEHLGETPVEIVLKNRKGEILQSTVDLNEINIVHNGEQVCFRFD